MNLHLTKSLQYLYALLFLALAFTACESENLDETITTESIELNSGDVETRAKCIRVLSQSPTRGSSCCEVTISTRAEKEGENLGIRGATILSGPHTSQEPGGRISWTIRICGTTTIYLDSLDPEGGFIENICSAELTPDCRTDPPTPTTGGCPLELTSMTDPGAPFCEFLYEFTEDPPSGCQFTIEIDGQGQVLQGSIITYPGDTITVMCGDDVICTMSPPDCQDGNGPY